jgi:arginase family enzyme
MQHTTNASSFLHLNLDNAWHDEPLHLPALDLRAWGPQLRFSAPPRLINRFYEEVESRLAPFLLYGSGDFHHLTALWIRRVAQPLAVVSFDNHPDWDVRPPKWCCGGWVNRALELPHVERVSVWGCGNFECWWPGQLFGNRRAERSGKLEVHPWADQRPAKDQRRRGAILRDNWRERFENFLESLGGADVYVTIDLDCLRAEEAVTNWENGRFAILDVAWALQRLRQHSPIVAGDICGAFSQPAYARRKQRFASEMDHPKLPPRSSDEINRINFAALEKLWPVLVGNP